MPLYNCEKYITEQLNSLLDQTYKNFEIIIVDDGSTDSTMQIVKYFISIDSRIKTFANEFNKGISGSLNTAMKYASGVYFARADGDDIHLPERLMLQVEFLESNPTIGIVGGRSIIFNDEGNIRQTYYPKSSIELAWKFISNTYFCHPSVMFRSEIYNQIGGYPNEVSEDFSFFSKVLKDFKGSNLTDVLLKYRVHNKSFSIKEAEKINLNVYNIFKQNYKYYVSTNKHMKDFYNFHVHGQLSPLKSHKILIINVQILNKIREDYSLKIYDTEFINIVLFKQLYWIIRAHFSFFKQKCFSIIKIFIKR